jgi:hypothetical protein
MSSNNVRGDISRAGIIFLQGLQLRVLLECGFYSREGLIWGNTVCPIMSLLEKAAYLMTSFFVWPTLPKFFFDVVTQITRICLLIIFFCIKFGDGESCGGGDNGDMYSEGIKYLLRA